MVAGAAARLSARWSSSGSASRTFALMCSPCSILSIIPHARRTQRSVPCCRPLPIAGIRASRKRDCRNARLNPAAAGQPVSGGTSRSLSAARRVDQRGLAACAGEGGHDDHPLCQGHPPSRRADGRDRPGLRRSGRVPARHDGRAVGASRLQRAQSLFQRWLHRERERVRGGWSAAAPVGVRSGRRAPTSPAGRNDHARADRSGQGDMGCARGARDRPIAAAANWTSGRDGCRHCRSADRQRWQEVRPSSLGSGGAALVVGDADRSGARRLRGRERMNGSPISARPS